ncbi:TonB-dependent receptor [Sphingorhabdus sp.]|uniref:TonB-dependent receptor n=1 Tax=Sphingorhabdus sp. TaxID=1902408 RepID=UPI0032B7E953
MKATTGIRKTVLALSVATCALAMPSLAFAQDEAQADDVDSETIVVTATRRAEALSEVPLAVSAVGGEMMQNSGATDIRQLTQLAPSLLVSSTGSEANGSARIRGIGTVGDNPGLESSVAVFIDGVYRSRSGIGLNELGEVERVEVLRGPQGTLFGRNASAGLIHVISKKPSFDFGGFLEATYGNFDGMRFSGALTGPVTEQLAARIEAVYAKRDGFTRLVSPTGAPTGERVNDRDRLFVKGQLLFQPSDALDIRIIADYTKRDEACCSGSYYSTAETFDPTPGVPGDYAIRAPGTGGSASGNRVVDILTSMGAFIPANPYDRTISITPGRTLDGHTRDWGVSAEVNWDLGGAELSSITGYRRYKSSQAGDVDYSTLDLLYRNDDGSAFRRFTTFTQELRLQGSAFDDKLDWLVGAYYANEKLALQDNLNFGSDYGQFLACRVVASVSANAALRDPDRDGDGCLSAAGSATVAGAFPGANTAGGTDGAQLIAALQRLSSMPAVTQAGSRMDHTSRNYAFFTHNIFNITDTLALTLGARYTNEKKTITGAFNINNPFCAAQQASAGAAAAGATSATARALIGATTQFACLFNTSSQLNTLALADTIKEDQITGTAVLSWKPVDDVMTYVSYSKGYKAGGFNLDRSALGSPLTPRANADTANLKFGAEKVDAYEIGVKYDSAQLDINVAAFRQEFKNFQLNTFNGLFFLVQNVNGCSDLVGGSGADEDLSATSGTCATDNVKPGVISEGLEIEATLYPGENVTVGLGATYLDSRYVSDLVGTANGAVALAPELFQLPGNSTSFAPTYSLTGSFSWTPPIGGSGLSGLFYIDTRLTSDHNTGSDRFPEKVQDGYFLVNGRIGIRGPDRKWGVELWVQNLLDEEYQQVAFNTPLQATGNGSRAHVQEIGSPTVSHSAQLFSAFLGEPRTWGLTARYRF